MKSFYTLLLLMTGLLLSSNSIAQGSLAALDEKNGFRDVKFGASINNYPGMKLTWGNAPLASCKTYKRKTDKLRIGDVKIDTVYYRFFKGRLSDVSFTFSGKEEADELLKAFELLYGPHQMEKSWIKWETAKNLIWYLPSITPSGDTFTQVTLISKPMFELIGKDDDVTNEAESKRRILEEQSKLKKRASDL